MANVMTSDEFRAVETLIITKPVYVAGTLKNPEETVDVSGNDKIQLLASGKAIRKPVADKKAK